MEPLIYSRPNVAMRAKVDTSSVFGEGSNKAVFQGVYTSGSSHGERCVVKVMKGNDPRILSAFNQELEIVRKAQHVIDKFNATGILARPIYLNNPEIWAFEPDSDWPGVLCLAEPMIDRFIKFNSNTGWTGHADTDWHAAMQALSHFAYHLTGGHLVLCDLQGGEHRDGVVLTDAVVMTRNNQYGASDLGSGGIQVRDMRMHCLPGTCPQCSDFDNLYLTISIILFATLELSISQAELGRPHLRTVRLQTFFSSHKCSKYCKQHWPRPKKRTALFPIREGSSMRNSDDELMTSATERAPGPVHVGPALPVIKGAFIAQHAERLPSLCLTHAAFCCAPSCFRPADCTFTCCTRMCLLAETPCKLLRCCVQSSRIRAQMARQQPRCHRVPPRSHSMANGDVHHAVPQSRPSLARRRALAVSSARAVRARRMRVWP